MAVLAAGPPADQAVDPVAAGFVECELDARQLRCLYKQRVKRSGIQANRAADLYQRRSSRSNSTESSHSICISCRCIGSAIGVGCWLHQRQLAGQHQRLTCLAAGDHRYRFAAG